VHGGDPAGGVAADAVGDLAHERGHGVEVAAGPQLQGQIRDLQRRA
jgi:hypothetical protein